jgi:hypothetical protein
MATDGTPLCPNGKEKGTVTNPTRAQLIPLHSRLVIPDDIYGVHGEGGEPMIAMILLIVMMAVTVAAMELITRCPVSGKESVESPAEIAGD